MDASKTMPEAHVAVSTPADLMAAMARAAATVDTALDTLLPEDDGPEGRLFEAMRYAALGGGKRFRAFLVMRSAALFKVGNLCCAGWRSD